MTDAAYAYIHSEKYRERMAADGIDWHCARFVEARMMQAARGIGRYASRPARTELELLAEAKEVRYWRWAGYSRVQWRNTERIVERAVRLLCVRTKIPDCPLYTDDEPNRFIYHATKAQMEAIMAAIRKRGLNWGRGPSWHGAHCLRLHVYVNRDGKTVYSSDLERDDGSWIKAKRLQLRPGGPAPDRSVSPKVDVAPGRGCPAEIEVCQRDSRPRHVYRWFDDKGLLLYVGISVNAFQRAAQHQAAEWFAAAKTMTLESAKDEKEALAKERRAILRERPLWNRAHNPCYQR